MKKYLFYTVVVVGLVAGITACSRTVADSVEDAVGEKTNLNIRLSLSAPSNNVISRGDIGTGTGLISENMVNTVTLKLESATYQFVKANTKPQTNTPSIFWKIASEDAYETSPVEVEDLPKIALILNGRTTTSDMKDIIRRANINNAPTGNEVIGTANSTLSDDYATQVKDDLAAVSTINGQNGDLLMTSEVKRVERLNLGVSSNAAYNGENTVSLDVERIVAKGFIYRPATTTAYDVRLVEGGEVVGRIPVEGMRYSVVNSATVAYLFRRMDGREGVYASQSAIHATVTAANSADEAKTLNLLRLSNIVSSTGALGGYAAQDVRTDINDDTSATDLAAKPGIYFFENTARTYVGDLARFGYNRFATAKLYVSFVPSTVWQLSGNALSATHPSNPVTFYFSVSNGKFYASIEAALTDGQDRMDIYTYKNGRMAYRTLWNRINGADGKTLENGGTRRNTVYALKIEGFMGLGMPWDPADPNDPNLPYVQGDEVNEPDGPGMDPNVNKTQTYMRVKASVIPWTVIKRQGALGNIN